jgi:hypothetical protein
MLLITKHPLVIDNTSHHKELQDQIIRSIHAGASLMFFSQVIILNIAFHTRSALIERKIKPLNDLK